MFDWYLWMINRMLEELKCSIIMNGDNSVLTCLEQVHSGWYALKLDILLIIFYIMAQIYQKILMFGYMI